MTKFKSKAALKAEVEALSPARQRLAEALSMHESLAGIAAETQTTKDRLAAAQGNSSKLPALLAELAKLDASESEAMTLWASKGGNAEPPILDSEKRGDLVRSIANARASDEAMRRAADELNNEHNDASRHLAFTSAQVKVAVSDVLAEAAEPLIDEFLATKAALERQATQLSQVAPLIAILGAANPSVTPVIGSIHSALRGRLEALPGWHAMEHDRLWKERVGMSAAETEFKASSLAKWQALAVKLEADPSAKLEG